MGERACVVNHVRCDRAKDAMHRLEGLVVSSDAPGCGCEEEEPIPRTLTGLSVEDVSWG